MPNLPDRSSVNVGLLNVAVVSQTVPFACFIYIFSLLWCHVKPTGLYSFIHVMDE